MDLMLITATEDMEYNQTFFEVASKGTYQKCRQPHNIKNEYELDEWDIFRRTEGEFDEEDKISDRQRAIRRIQHILQEIPPNK